MQLVIPRVELSAGGTCGENLSLAIPDDAARLTRDVLPGQTSLLLDRPLPRLTGRRQSLCLKTAFGWKEVRVAGVTANRATFPPGDVAGGRYPIGSVVGTVRLGNVTIDLDRTVLNSPGRTFRVSVERDDGDGIWASDSGFDFSCHKDGYVTDPRPWANGSPALLPGIKLEALPGVNYRVVVTLLKGGPVDVGAIIDVED